MYSRNIIQQVTFVVSILNVWRMVNKLVTQGLQPWASRAFCASVREVDCGASFVLHTMFSLQVMKTIRGLKWTCTYRNSVNIRMNLLFVSWQVYGNKMTVNVNVLIIICKFIFVNVKHLRKYNLLKRSVWPAGEFCVTRKYNLWIKQNTTISLTENYWIMVV